MSDGQCDAHRQCADQDPCTDDSCSPQGNCVHTGNTAACDDGLFCNGADTCSSGSCGVHAGDPCLAGAECADTCDETNDTCNLPLSTPCAVDADVCTDDVCDGSGNCSHPNNTAACNDGLFCNGADTCSSGSCGVHAGDPCSPTSCDEVGDACSLTPSPHLVSVVSGGSHTCGLTADGVVYCWGEDLYGQLGNGGAAVDTQSPSVVDTSSITGNKAFVQLTAGFAHTCGLTGDGVAYCWGWDFFDQLGNGGASIDAQSPSAVNTSLITGNKAFAQLTAGFEHTCGLTGDGVAYCWGRDNGGQLGNGGTSINALVPSAVDTSPITGNKALVQLATGAGHTCGLTANGVAYCWGDDFVGALGNGGAALGTQSPTAVDASPLSSNKAFVQLTAGQRHTCGLTADRVAHCWGSDSAGQLGNGGTAVNTQSPSAVDTSPITGNKAFVQLTTGGSGACGLTPDGKAYCWGADSSGELGNGGASATTQSPSLVDTSTISGNKAFVQLTAGGSHACGLMADGAAYCWGADTLGQLGDGGSVVDRQSPSAVDTSPISGNKAFVQLSAGVAHTCGLMADGATYCWGADSSGELGNGGTSANTQSPSLVDTSTISGNKAFIEVDVGSLHACGLMIDGALYCWGRDVEGQLGNGGASANSQSPSAVDTVPISGNKAFVRVTAGVYETCAITAEHVPYCWGSDAYGQLGNGGTSLDVQSASAVDTSTIASNQAFVRLSIGGGHACGMGADGVAHCWGADTAGQLGNGGTSVNTQGPSAVDTSTLAGNRAFFALDAGGPAHTCGLAADGAAHCWGEDLYGQLGNGGTSQDTQSPSAVDISGL